MVSKGNSQTDVETVEPTSIARAKPFVVMLRAMATDATAATEEYTGEDLFAILEAETEEELFESDNRPPLNFQHLAGCEIAILGFDIKFSRGGNTIDTIFQHEGKKMYILANCVRLSDKSDKGNLIRLPEVGVEFQANTSAKYVVVKLWRAMTLGLIDRGKGKSWEVTVEETDLGDGQAVLKLRPIPKRATQA